MSGDNIDFAVGAAVVRLQDTVLSLFQEFSGQLFAPDTRFSSFHILTISFTGLKVRR